MEEIPENAEVVREDGVTHNNPPQKIPFLKVFLQNFGPSHSLLKVCFVCCRTFPCFLLTTRARKPSADCSTLVRPYKHFVKSISVYFFHVACRMWFYMIKEVSFQHEWYIMFVKDHVSVYIYLLTNRCQKLKHMICMRCALQFSFCSGTFQNDIYENMMCILSNWNTLWFVVMYILYGRYGVVNVRYVWNVRYIVNVVFA